MPNELFELQRPS